MAAPGLSLSTRPRLAMTPLLRQSLSVLAMRASAITRLARQLGDDNPMLDIRLPDAPMRSAAGADLPPDFDQFSHDAVHPASLAEHLEREIRLQLRDADQRAVGLSLIEHVSPAGWLDPSGAAAAARLGVEGTAFEALLGQLQALDPPGVFARNLAECLALQLDRLEMLDADARAVLAVLDRLADGGMDALVSASGLSAEATAAVLARLRRCNPKPGAAFSHDDGDIFRPDLIIETAGDGFSVSINDASLPMVTVKDQDGDDEASRLLARRARDEARFLNAAIRHRSEMLLAAGGMLVQHQAAFLCAGERAIQPLSMAMLADRLGCNKSTVSRLVADKLCQTPRGMLALRDFFATGLRQPDGSQVAGRAVAARLVELVAAEDRAAPLSDDALGALLAAEGFTVARRTIAKYRQENMIPNWQDRQKGPLR